MPSIKDNDFYFRVLTAGCTRVVEEDICIYLIRQFLSPTGFQAYLYKGISVPLDQKTFVQELRDLNDGIPSRVRDDEGTLSPTSMTRVWRGISAERGAPSLHHEVASFGASA